MYIVWFSDLHVGSTVGLWPKRHRVEGGGVYEGNRYQGWLLECWQDALSEIKSLPGPVVGILNGDLIQGVNAKDAELVTNKIDVQVGAAMELLEPLVGALSQVYMIRGSEFHDGKAAEHLEMLAALLHAEVDASTGQNTRWELYLALGEDVVVHSAHHIGKSSVPWYEATIPLRELLMQLAELSRFYGESAPQVKLVVRSHRHRGVGIWVPPDIQVYVTPGWQLATAYSRRSGLATLPQIGYLLAEYDHQDLVVKPRMYSLPALEIEHAATYPSTIRP